MTTRPADSMIDVAALRGLLQLGVSGTVGVASLAQAMYEAVLATSPLPWMPASALVNGVARLAYGSVRGVAGAVGKGGDSLLSLAERRIGGERRLSKRREFAVPLGLRSALNGVVGDRLEALANPMALPMTIEAHRWSRSGVHRAARGPRVLFIHGLCMTDEHWQAPTARGEDFGDRLARESGLRPLYLRYNTGLAIAENGRRLAALLEIRHRGRRAWQEPFHVVAHSLGGLVLRSAIAEGLSQGHVWTERLQHVVSLGTPHDGAPLERLGKSVEAALRLSRFSSPWAVLASVRSVAIQQLGHAAVAPWPSVPPSLRWHAVAGALGSRDRGRLGAFLGDGLVPVASALGQHREGSAPEFAERTVLQGVGHLALVRHPSVAHLLIRRMT